MALKKDKEKVLDEQLSDERIQEFLSNYTNADDCYADFNVLLKAYRGFRASDFDRFLKYFLEQERNVNAKNANGETLLTVISEHALGQDYVNVLKAAGAC